MKHKFIAILALLLMLGGFSLASQQAKADPPPIPAQCLVIGGCTVNPQPPATNYYAAFHTPYTSGFNPASVIPGQLIFYPAGTCTNCGYDITTAYGTPGTAGARLGRNVYQADGNWVEYVSDNSGTSPAPGVAIFQTHTSGKTNGELIWAANGGISIRDRTTGAVLWNSGITACSPAGTNSCQNDVGTYGNGHFVVSRWNFTTGVYESVWNQ